MTAPPKTHPTSQRPPDSSALASVLGDWLADVRELIGASRAVLWDSTREGEAPSLLAFACADGGKPALDDKATGLIEWASQQRIGEMCTDGEVVRFAATPVIVTDALRLILAVSCPSEPLGMPREKLRTWLPRFASRLAVLHTLIEAQVDGARAERNADLLLLTATQLQEHRTVEGLGASLCSAAAHMTGDRRVALVRWQASLGTGEVAYATRGHLVGPGWPIDVGSQVAAACVGEFPVLLEDLSDRRQGVTVYGANDGGRTLGSLIILPLRGADGIIGALVAEGDEPLRISAGDAKNLRLLGLLGAAALETVWEIEEINRRARTDALTGLANRQQFEERLTRIVMETNRFGGSCTLVVIDIDRFKHVNDTFGHQIGDQVLQRVAAVLQREVRTVDLCARYGGEEMALLLPQTALDGGVLLAARLRKAIAAHAFSIAGREIPLTISLGVATYPEGARDRDELFAAADRALYSAKRGGRNRVVAGAV
ncbi:MAG TPA: GGDEF domain-containing protein [Candidatus Elarobacter sp.]|nr:GGDEF domain-containing protein [Candidatus Elarobacter sp.]